MFWKNLCLYDDNSTKLERVTTILAKWCYYLEEIFYANISYKTLSELEYSLEIVC
jgi:hypothetical protein